MKLDQSGRGCVAAVLFSALMGCGNSQDVTAGVQQRGTLTIAGLTASAFPGPGYTYTPPPGWFAKPAIGTWELGVSPLPGTSGFDMFTSREGDLWIMVGQRPVAPGVSLRQWVHRMTASHTITYGPGTCVAPEHTAEGSLGGEPAIIRSFHCPVDGPKGMAVHVLALHGHRGYLTMCGSPQGRVSTLPNLEHLCTRSLNTFRFHI